MFVELGLWSAGTPRRTTALPNAPHPRPALNMKCVQPEPKPAASPSDEYARLHRFQTSRACSGGAARRVASLGALSDDTSSARSMQQLGVRRISM